MRCTRRESAAQRIETVLARWEQELNRPLLRPVVLEGDIAEPDLALDPRDSEWVAANCHAVIHSAASLTFVADDPEGEPWRSNIQGTRNVLDLCRRAGIRHCHYVSTAYVCGRRRGRILESELDVGQELGNDYEISKLTAEKEVCGSGIFDRVTVYRPSIIVGDSRTGFTTSFHGFYTPLRLIHSLLQTVPWQTVAEGDWLGGLHLAGGEHKNLVPVEWVSAAMTELIRHDRHHGRTYHLTNPRPATVSMMQQAIGAALAQRVLDAPPPRTSTAADDLVPAFRQQMQVYKSYWSDDPQFDSSQTQAALPDLPCPLVDLQVMQRLICFAIDTNFGWPREAPQIPDYELQRELATWLAAENNRDQALSGSRCVSLRVSGKGGGQYHLLVDRGQIVGAGRGVRVGGGPTCYLTSATFAALARGNLSLDDSINTGRLVVTGNSVGSAELARVFHDLTTPRCGEAHDAALRRALEP